MRRDVFEATDCRTHEIEPWRTVSRIPSAEDLDKPREWRSSHGRRQENDRASGQRQSNCKAIIVQCKSDCSLKTRYILTKWTYSSRDIPKRYKIYIYIYRSVCVCVCVCMCARASVCLKHTLGCNHWRGHIWITHWSNWCLRDTYAKSVCVRKVRRFQDKLQNVRAPHRTTICTIMNCKNLV
jgi:hypothetical protein